MTGSEMPVLLDRTNFDPFLKTPKLFTLKISKKHRKGGQNFAILKNAKNVSFETCLIHAKNLPLINQKFWLNM